MNFQDRLTVEVGQDKAQAILDQAERIVKGLLYTRPWFRGARRRGVIVESHSDFVAHVAGTLLMKYAAGMSNERQAGVHAMRDIEAHYRTLYSWAYKNNQHANIDTLPESCFELPDPQSEVEVEVERIRSVATPRQLEIAEAVASLGSRSEAARVLGIAKSSVIQTMQAIERKLVDA